MARKSSTSRRAPAKLPLSKHDAVYAGLLVQCERARAEYETGDDKLRELNAEFRQVMLSQLHHNGQKRLHAACDKLNFKFGYEHKGKVVGEWKDSNDDGTEISMDLQITGPRRRTLKGLLKRRNKLIDRQRHLREIFGGKSRSAEWKRDRLRHMVASKPELVEAITNVLVEHMADDLGIAA